LTRWFKFIASDKMRIRKDLFGVRTHLTPVIRADEKFNLGKVLEKFNQVLSDKRYKYHGTERSRYMTSKTKTGPI